MAIPQLQRTERTRRRLLDAAQALFADQGYGATSTDQVLKAAGVTRGALYHHFRDKADLLAALCERLQAEAAAAIGAATAGLDDPVDALLAGAEAWLAVFARPDMRRILAIDAPSVLGLARWSEIDRRHGFRLLLEGVEAAQAAGRLPDLPAGDLATLLNGAMNAAVLALPEGAGTADLDRAQAAVRALLLAVTAAGPS